jgi:predicted RecB family nuclease
MPTGFIQEPTVFLTDQLLLNFQRCHRQAFLEVHGDVAARGQVNDFLLKLGEDKRRFQQELLQDQSVAQPEYPRHDWEAGAAATQDLMRLGVPVIRNGVLLAPQPQRSKTQSVAFVSTPDLLMRRPGVSFWGDWLYVPVDIKLSKRPKLEYQILAAFHAMVLAEVQGTAPENPWLYLREKGWYTVDLERVLVQMEELRAALLTMLLNESEPEVFIARNRCSMCVWFDHCYAIAQSDQHLSLLPGVTPTRYPVLKAHALASVEALAQSDPVGLHSKTGLGHDITRKLVFQAQSFVHNQPVFLTEALDSHVLMSLPTSPIELYFDIEAEPSLNLVYLHGVLVVDRLRKVQQFYPCLAKSAEEEEAAWHALVEIFVRYPDAPIFHFCAYEVQTVARLAQLYGAPHRFVESLRPRFFDIHAWVTRTAALPIESYTLKLIAKWLGFEWRNSAANGAQAICWYSQWIETGDPQFLDDIVLYNEDDCLATYRVKDWLAQFLAEQVEIHLPPVASGF